MSNQTKSNQWILNSLETKIQFNLMWETVECLSFHGIKLWTYCSVNSKRVQPPGDWAIQVRFTLGAFPVWNSIRLRILPSMYLKRDPVRQELPVGKVSVSNYFTIKSATRKSELGFCEIRDIVLSLWVKTRVIRFQTLVTFYFRFVFLITLNWTNGFLKIILQSFHFWWTRTQGVWIRAEWEVKTV